MQELWTACLAAERWDQNWNFFNRIEAKSGRWYTYPSEKMKVSWDDDIPNIWKNKKNVLKHQPDYVGHEFIMSKKRIHPIQTWVMYARTLPGIPITPCRAMRARLAPHHHLHQHTSGFSTGQDGMIKQLHLDLNYLGNVQIYDHSSS